MKSTQVFVLFVGIALLTVNLALADGEEATDAGTEGSPSATDSSVPPSPQEAGGNAPPEREKEYWIVMPIGCSGYECRINDPNAKSTEQYQETTDGETRKCIRIYLKDAREAEKKENEEDAKCISNCDYLPSRPRRCREKCFATFTPYPPTKYSCGLILIAKVGITIGVIILLGVIAVVGGCLFCWLKKKKRGVVAGRPFDNRGQPAAVGPAAPPGYANQAPPPYANQPPTTAPSAYAYQPPAAPQGYANQAPPAYAYQPPPAPPAYANQPLTAPQGYANQAPPAYAYQPPPAPPAYANQPPTAPPAYANQPPTAPNG